MAKILTTDLLIKSTKRRAMLPIDESTFGKQGIIDILNEEVDLGLISHLLAVHEEYLVFYKDFELNSPVNEYQIPSRAIGSKLRGAFLVSSSNNMQKLTRIELENVDNVEGTSTQSLLTNGFYVQNDKLILLAQNSTNYVSLRMYFYMKLSELVEDKYASVVVNINTTTNEIVVDKLPATFTADKLYDFTSYKSPNALMSYDIVATSIVTNTKTITFESIPSDLKVGDYITVAETSIVPQLPSELHALLAQRAAVACLEALNDTEGLTSARAKLVEIQNNTTILIDNRVESANQKINNSNTLLKQSLRRFRRRS